MYVPRYQKVENEGKALDYIRHNGFGTLISYRNTLLQATHIPFHLSEKNGTNYLTCHIAKANTQKIALENDQEVLAIFMNTHAYVSSSWYDHINVPTWNYIAVHVYGKIRCVEGAELVGALGKMVDQYETGRADRFQIEDMDDTMFQAHISSY